MASATESSEESLATLKFLVSNAFAGTIIGSKGTAVKELMEVSGARVTISGNKEFYPGTSDRVLVISGNLESLLVAISLIWELIYLQTKVASKGAAGSRSVAWSPAESKDNLKGTDDIELTTKITIPASAGGLVLGRSGATLRLITETSGATVQMTEKEAALFTQERVITITGFVSQGRLCTQLIIQKMCEDEDAMTYANRGTRYNPSASGVAGVRRTARPRDESGDPSTSKASTTPITETTMKMTVADSLIGNIIGKNGATLREMTSLSGAKIVISPREESVDNNRIIDITGEPAAVQNASIFITEKLRLGKYAKPRGRRTES
jgi:RNA-binding protein Nova